MRIVYSERISRAKPYPFAEIDRKVRQIRDSGRSVIDFGVGDPSSPTPDFILDELALAARQHASTGYPSYIGSEVFRRASAEHMRQNFGVTLNPETQISSTVGSKEAVFHFPLGFVDAGDLVICPTPGYPVYKTGTEFAGGEPYCVALRPENGFLIDFESIPDSVADRAKIIWTNYPNSPTGVSAPRDWLEGLIAWSRKHNIIIAADEGCYIDLYFGEKPLSVLEVAGGDMSGMITFYSLSKRNNMTGYRVGFVAGDEQIVKAFQQVKTNIDSGTPNFIQAAAARALLDHEHVVRMRDEYRLKREAMLAAFRTAGFPETPGDATFYLWQRGKNGISGLEFAGQLLDLGIVVTPGAALGEVVDGKNPGEEYVRFSLVPSVEEVQRAADQIARL